MMRTLHLVTPPAKPLNKSIEITCMFPTASGLSLCGGCINVNSCLLRSLVKQQKKKTIIQDITAHSYREDFKVANLIGSL